MGKDSLIKSTAKTKGKKEETPKKTTAKKKSTKTTLKTTAKASPKKTTKTKAPKSTAKKKNTTKAAPKATPKKTKSTTKPKTKPATKKSAKKMTVKELLFKSFSPISKMAKPQSAPRPKLKMPSAPPFVSASDPKEVARIRGLLLQSHSLADVMATAKAPTVKPTPAPVIPEKVKPVAQTVSPGPSETPAINTNVPTTTAPDPVSKAAKILATSLGVVILLVLMVSQNNSSKYYVQPKDKAIEIWKGRFSPKDKKFFMVLHGTQLPGKVKDVYSKAEVFPLIFTYYLNKADTLLEVPGLPDFDGIKSYLHDAKKFAVDNKMSKTVGTRLHNIERMILLYKADVAISKSTISSLDSAMKHLKSAQKLITSPTQEQEIQQKLSLATNLKAALKAKASQKKGK